MNLVARIKDILSKRKIILNLAASDFKKKFVGSYFGIFWMFVQPVVTIFIYYCVFQLGFKSAPPTGINVPYVLWLVPGIVPWFFINEAISNGTGCLIDYNYLVKKVVFKVSVLPVIKIVSCLFVHLIFVGIMMIVYMLFGQYPTVYWLQAIYYTMCAFVFSLGITFLTSSINVFFKDMGQIVNIFLQFGMWIAPIMWPYTMVAEKWQWVLKLNPVYYIVEGYRDSFITKVWFFEHYTMSIYFWIATLVLFVIGGVVFRKLKPHFADVL